MSDILPHTAFPLYTFVPGISFWYVQIFSYKDPDQIGLELTQGPYFNLIISLKTFIIQSHSPNTVTF